MVCVALGKIGNFEVGLGVGIKRVLENLFLPVTTCNVIDTK